MAYLLHFQESHGISGTTLVLVNGLWIHLADVLRTSYQKLRTDAAKDGEDNAFVFPLLSISYASKIFGI